MDNATDSHYDEKMNPAEIARAVAAGKANAETRLFQQYQPIIMRLLMQQTGDPALAEDLTHDTMIAVLKTLRNDGLRDASRLTSYVCQTARFQFLCWLRKSANRAETGGSLDHLESASAMPEHMYFSDLEREQVHRSISDLNVPRDREILMRHYVHEQTKPEICEALLLSSQHFDRVISRARLRLKEGLEQQLDMAAT